MSQLVKYSDLPTPPRAGPFPRRTERMVSLGASKRASLFTTPAPFPVATLLRANEQRVVMGFARTLLAAFASKGQAAGALLVCSQRVCRCE